jgi:putative ABC transport system permease protein
MLRIALRDLQWRSRRVLIVLVGASLVLALALVMSGLSAGFENESARTVGLTRGTLWVIDQGGTGPFLQPTPLNAGKVNAVIRQVGALHAAPVLFGRQSVRRSNGRPFGAHEHVNLVGAMIGQLGSPRTVTGKELRTSGEAVVDVGLGAKLGDHLRLGDFPFTVVGTVRGARLLAGVPNVYVTLRDAQLMAFGGQNLATAVVADRPVAAPPGTKVLNNRAARIDGLRPVVNAQKTIALVRTLLWLVAALIVGSVTYLGVLERSRDVAVLKGMGARSRSLAASVVLQGAFLGLGASALGSALALAIGPLFPLSAEIPTSAFVALPMIAVAVGVAGSLVATKRLVSIQPALAFGA